MILDHQEAKGNKVKSLENLCKILLLTISGIDVASVFKTRIIIPVGAYGV